eukprot:TRINITY_DN544_c0_g1_i1.p1 TRINITY_DN544_c0_g1~~TRINITY_DN544_c0_g1_i1.p1  ORF type:complete len:173 (+),score=25.51 TRINITY_DN544_c0_g1_i1:222-740(+)
MDTCSTAEGFPSSGELTHDMEMEQRREICKMVGAAINDFIGNVEGITEELQPFLCKGKPSVSIADYALRLLEKTSGETTTIIFALIYIDRLFEKRQIPISRRAIHKLFLAAFLLAAKFLVDEPISLAIFAKAGGISMAELTCLELHLLELLDFTLCISPQRFMRYSSALNLA